MQRTFSADDAWHFGAGTHLRLWEVLGAHVDTDGTTFRVWAPNASAVSVLGTSNKWMPGVDELEPDNSGVWRGTFAGFGEGDSYKYAITSPDGSRRTDKADPVAFACELAPQTASIIATPHHDWADDAWMSSRASKHRFDSPISIYEMHLGSWRYEPGGYRAIGEQLAEYCVDMGFTHVELLPLMEHPFYGSWGYQTTGYFSPTSRYGSPQDLMAMIDHLHQAGVGVILDWVPSHFPVDEHALGFFDGTHLFEHADPRQGFHPDWTSFVFNYERPEVRSFLLSSAHYWLDQFHIDGIRVDAVASMLYLDYSREDGEWIANEHGGKENLGAINFLRELNRTIYLEHPDVFTAAEESTAWPGVTNPVDADGLGFGFKWDMGWMHDTLEYMSHDPVHRRWAHDRITFRSIYQAAEHYILPLSHDEVVHGKGSLLAKMPGDRWQQFANLRVLFGYQWTAPGKKLLFMGQEFGADTEWSHESELGWALLGESDHAGLQGWVRRLNELYRDLPALSLVDRDPSGFAWVVNDDSDQSVLAFLRQAPDHPSILVVINNTPVPRTGYRLGVGSPVESGDAVDAAAAASTTALPKAAASVSTRWTLVANSDDSGYGGSGMALATDVLSEDQASHGFDQSVALDLAPLAVQIYVEG